MNILFLNGAYPFCYYYRGFLPGVYSGQMVVNDFIKLNGQSTAEEVTRLAQKADVVVMQRPNDRKRLELVRALKKAGKKVIFENDDTYLVGKGIMLDRLNNDSQRAKAVEISTYTNQILAMCDGAIASTPILAKEYSEINPNVAVLKNCIDPLDEYPTKKNTTGKFRVGFVGSVTTNDDYLHIKDQIKALDERGDVTIVVMGIKYQDGSRIDFMEGDYKFWNSLQNVEWKPYVPINGYMMTLADLALDVAIIPREDNYFNRCKSNLKFLEMSLLRIPVIAQGFPDGTSPYQGVDEEYMTVVVDNLTWLDKILDVKLNHDKYLSLANKAHDYVLEHYNIETYASQWVETIKKLCNK